MTSDSGRGAAPIHTWLAEPLPKPVAQAIDRLSRADDVRHIAVMPDVHLAEDVCVGCVVATESVVYPQAVGADIGCGMAAVAMDAAASEITPEVAGDVLSRLRSAVPVMRHRSLSASPSPPQDLAPDLLSHPQLANVARREGRVEFATLGRGNHFLELQADDEDRLWLMVHSGSRIMGQAITAHHRERAVSGRAGLWRLDADSPQGRAYLADAAWAERYAFASRSGMLKAAAAELGRVLRAEVLPRTAIHCGHNHVRREQHLGRERWVHRKGANAAAAGQPGIIPGSMATPSFHVLGRGDPLSLCSSSHGAGRAMSRSEARARINPRQLARELRDVHTDPALVHRLAEEAPSAYKDVRKVMRAQRDLVTITRTLRPVLSYKAP